MNMGIDGKDNAAVLQDFLLKLATSPEAYTSFISEPDELMAREGVPAEYRQALVSGDAVQIHNLIATRLSRVDHGVTGSKELSAAPVVTKVDTGQNGPAPQNNLYHQWYLWWLSTSPGAATYAVPGYSEKTPAED